MKDIPKYEVAMNLNSKVNKEKEEKVDNEFKLIQETMKDIERMRIQENEED